MTDVSGQPLAAGQLAQLANMKLAMKTMLDAQEAGEGSPRLALFYGFSGYGKSVASAFVAAHTCAAYVAAQSIWTQRSLLEAIARELGIARIERTGPRILQQVIEQLTHDPRPLIIDEMDHLVKKQCVEIIRDIHDATRIPIMMIGEESLPAKLREWERFHNRILVATPAQPADMTDARALRDVWCTRVAIDDELLELVVDRCRGVTRRIVTNLKAIQRAAIEDGRSAAGLDWWGSRPIETGDYPARRILKAA